MKTPKGNENAFLGALVGFAIGDALGLPVLGKTAEEMPEFDTYLELPGETESGEPNKGAISDRTEIALCLVESLTTNDAQLDPENINARLNFLVDSPSRQWMSDTVVDNIDKAFEYDGLVPDGTGTTIEPSVAARGVILGLVHSVGERDPETLRNEAAMAARITHDDAASAAAAAYVAAVTSEAARYVDAEPDWQMPEPGFSGEIADRLVKIAETVKKAEKFEDAVLAAVRAGGDTTAYGAIAGGIAGARFGAAGLPQSLIDDLDARIYLSMAAPWFYRTAMKRQGFAIELHMDNQYPS